ncbi:hypothetical protein BC940DRAFT_299015 [Gongronella butleri]|nr:hypothetical protein BC940DRAFT_299015 [Gongronella butleri]
MSLLLVQIAAGPIDSSSNSHQKDKVQRISIVFIDFRCFHSLLRVLFQSVEWCCACMCSHARMAMKGKKRERKKMNRDTHALISRDVHPIAAMKPQHSHNSHFWDA